jgi:hypothetical protein
MMTVHNAVGGNRRRKSKETGYYSRTPEVGGKVHGKDE